MRTVFSTLLLSIALIDLVNAQDDEDPSEAPTRQELEQIIVTSDRTFSALRFMLQDAKEDLYATFNDLIDDEDFFVDCRKTNYTRTRIQKDVCVPRFFDEAITENARNSIDFMNFGPPAVEILLSEASIAREQNRRFEELRSTIETLALEDESFGEALLEFARIQREYDYRKATCEAKPAVLFVFRKC